MSADATAVIINQAAGARGADVRTRVEAALAGAGVEARVVAAQGSDLRAAAGRAVREGARRVVAGGGDGTLNAVASALAGTDVAFGVLPLGTLNHFARDLGIPLELDAAARVVAAGRVRRVDVGEINGRVFLNNASLGLYPAIVRLRERERARLHLGKLPALAWATLRALRRNHTLAVQVDAAGEHASLRTPFAFVGNNEYVLEGFSAGGRSRLDAGVLSLYTASDEGRLGLLRLALRATVGHLREAPEFHSLSAAGFEIGTARHHLAVAIDGEVERFEAPLRFRSRPGALCVIAPPAASGKA